MNRLKELEEVKKIFGLDPRKIGLRFRNFWIINKPDEDYSMEEKGYLLVKTRDGGSNLTDETVKKYPNYIGSAEDQFDYTYRYYYFKPL